MTKAEWGTKLTCQSCAAKFYDFKKSEPACPSCGTVFEAEKTKSRRSAPPAEVEKPKAVEPKKDDASGDDDVELDVDDDLLESDDSDSDEDDGLIEDTSDIGEDDDDMAGVIENIDEDEKE